MGKYERIVNNYRPSSDTGAFEALFKIAKTQKHWNARN